ncbi:MAG: prolyl oligopeptidase family serine peptidase [Gammaproteobacteria bacterium]|nr:prolyl oligopeptidase family serine peptidase [Gammaproteobacteria bacterium]
MKAWVTSRRILITWIGLFGCCVAVAEPPPAASFGKLPPMMSVNLSPDGTRAVVLRALNDSYHVTLLDFKTRKSSMLMAAKPDEFLFNWCRWANNARIVCSFRSYIVMRAGQTGVARRSYRDGRTVMTRLLAVNADGSNVLQLVPPAQSRSGRDLVWNSPDQSTVISWLQDEPDHILMQIAREDRLFPSIYKININNNKMQRVRRQHGSVVRWYADRRGKLRFATGRRNNLKPVVFAIDEKGRMREMDMSYLAGINVPEPLGLSLDGKHSYVAANNGADTMGIFRINVATGEVVDTLYTNTRFDAGRRLIRHPRTGEPVVLEYLEASLRHHWFDGELEASYERAVAVLPGAPSTVSIASVDREWNRVVLRAEGNGTFPTYYLYDDAAKTLLALGRSYSDLGHAVSLNPVVYEARDGQMIPAYYAVPDAGEGPFPTVILPHGGPYARDSDRFDYRVQFLVSRGIAVLKPNYRGSAGYGDVYLAAGFDQWGLKMQDDVIDGLDWMVEQGIADGDRVCIVGGSYGGYVALVAAYKTPERLRCAVSFAGVTDLPELVKHQLNFRFGRLAVARIQGGKSRSENSPLDHVDEIGVPLLIVHGDVDRSVMIEQSRTLVAALEEAGKPYRYIEQPNGDHFLSLESHRIEFLEALDEFLGEHLLGKSGR